MIGRGRLVGVVASRALSHHGRDRARSPLGILSICALPVVHPVASWRDSVADPLSR